MWSDSKENKQSIFTSHKIFSLPAKKENPNDDARGGGEHDARISEQ
jgi:hypothetical protein